jgi:hypothetical protein
MESTNRRNVVDSIPPQQPAGRENRVPPNPGLGYNIAAILAAIPGMVWAALIILIFSLLIGLIWQNSLPGFLAGMSNWLLWGVRIGAGLFLIKGLCKAYKAFHQLQLDTEARKTARVNTQKQYLALEEKELKIEHLRVQIQADRQRAETERQLMFVAMQNGNGFEWRKEVFKVHSLPAPSIIADGVGPQRQPLLGAGTPSPTQEFLLSQLPENEYIVSPGVRRSNGQIVKVNITEIPHLKIIGSSGFGKSCLAAALLNQATTLNNPDMLRISLLDLEHKTSRLFENLPHVAELRVGQRSVPMVATDAEEVAIYFGYLKKELDRRARLCEDDLDREPVLLTYVEEMLSLQYEVVDEKMLDQMLAHLTVLAVRGRKYRMFLMCCTQTDYSTDELKIAQKQFRFRAAGGVDVTAARAAGFQNTELIKQNFQTGEPGQGLFVVEFPSFSDIVIAPRYDWKAQLQAPNKTVREVFTGPLGASVQALNSASTPPETPMNVEFEQAEQAWQARLEQVREFYVQKNWGKIAIIEKVWNVKRGGSQAYRQAEAEYNAMMTEIEKGGNSREI